MWLKIKHFSDITLCLWVKLSRSFEVTAQCIIPEELNFVKYLFSLCFFTGKFVDFFKN
jgi:hypothetical protein